GRDPALKEDADIFVHAGDPGLLFEKPDDLRVGALAQAQLRIPVRIRQTAHVEYEIDIGGDAVLVAERYEHQRQRRHPALDDALPDQAAQLVDIEIAGVY